VNQALDRLLVRLRARLAKTPLPRFFAWWGSNLLACLPPRWRALLSERSESLLVSRSEDRLVVLRERSDGSVAECGRIDAAQPAEAQAAEFARLRQGIEDPAVRTVYCIPNERILARALTLPAAAEDNLRQVLAFEMDRQTPFKADQVYFDSRVLGRDANGRNIRVELVLMPRTQLDAEVAAVGNAGIALDEVDCWRDEAATSRHHVNLLPPERRARHRDLRLPLNLGLGALAVILLALNMSESVANRAAAEEAMRAEVEQANTAAKRVAALKKTLTESISGANFLTDKKRASPLVIALLDDVTRRLPDDTYLERLSIDNGQLQLQGQAREAAKLIGVLAESELIANPGFQGQIQPDPRSGLERFQINSEIRKGIAFVPPDRAAKTPAATPAAAPPAEKPDQPAAGAAAAKPAETPEKKAAPHTAAPAPGGKPAVPSRGKPAVGKGAAHGA
jgi:general secretion pathway protein L